MTKRDLRSRHVAAAVVTVATLMAVTACADSGATRPRTAVVANETKATYSYVVPKGTNELALRGTTVNIIPNPFVMKIGETVRITNQDSVGYTIGPFYVGPNETVTQVATTPGTYTGVCLLHAGEELKVVITR